MTRRYQTTLSCYPTNWEWVSTIPISMTYLCFTVVYLYNRLDYQSELLSHQLRSIFTIGYGPRRCLLNLRKWLHIHWQPPRQLLEHIPLFDKPLLFAIRDQHGYQKPAGLSAGLPGVGVRVWCLYPTQNPYPSTGWRVWSGIQTPLEKRDQRVSLLCWHLCHTRKWDIHARFRVFLPLLSTITTSAHQMDTLTTLKSQNRATTGRMGEAHPFSQ